MNQTPVFYAARRSGAPMVRRLLEHGADAAHRDRRGYTPVCWAERLASARELCAQCAVEGRPFGTKTALASCAQWHERSRRTDEAAFLSACAAVSGLRRVRVSWAVARSSAG